MRKIVYILIILTFNITALAQNNQQPASSQASGQPFSLLENPNASNLYSGILGSRIPKNHYEEKMLKKLLKTTLTKREAAALTKKDEFGRSLTPTEMLAYKNAKNKVALRQQILYKYTLDTAAISAMRTAKLTQVEKQILEKAQDSSASLTPEEKKILRRAKHKQAKIERIRKRYTLTQQDKKLLEKAKIDTVKLSMSEKIKLWQVERKQKRIEQIKLQKAASKGDWLPVKVNTFNKLIADVTWASRTRPSSYMRKMHYLKKRYELTDKQKEALNKAKGGYPLNFVERIRAYNARRKQWLYQYKLEQLKHKYFLSLQDKDTRKRLKQQDKKQKAKYTTATLNAYINQICDSLKELF